MSKKIQKLFSPIAIEGIKAFKILKFIIAFGLFATLLGCNSLFYHPDSMDWTLPEKIHNAFEEHRIPVGRAGETLHLWHFKTPKPKQGTIVHFHGNAQNMSAHILFVAWLLHEGFDLVSFDYRGYGKSDGHATRENTVEDGEAILNWLSLKEKKKNVFVIAQSLGGAVATVALQRATPSNIAGVVIESSFVSYQNLAQKKLSSFFLTWPLQWPLSFLITDTLSPELQINNFKFPTLVIHGTKDNVVPISEGLALADHLQSANSPSLSFYTVVGGSHTSCFSSHTLSPCKKNLLDFLQISLQTASLNHSRISPQ